jgi:hypothetical protein
VVDNLFKLRIGDCVQLVSLPTGKESKSYPLTVGNTYKITDFDGSNVCTTCDEADRIVSYSRERVKKIVLLAIEQITYRQEFNLIGDNQTVNIWRLVDNHDEPVARNKPIKIKSRHGEVRELAWGTNVAPIS